MVILFEKKAIIFFCILLYGCPTYDPPTGALKIENQSNQNIYLYATCEEKLPCFPPLKVRHSLGNNSYDSKGKKITDTLFYPNYRIPIDSVGYINVWGSPKNPKVFCEDGKIRLFVISESDMKSNKWETLCKAQRFEIKLIFTQKQLDSLGWKITYP